MYNAVTIATSNSIHGSGDQQSTSGILMNSKNLSHNANGKEDCFTSEPDKTTTELETSTLLFTTSQVYTTGQQLTTGDEGIMTSVTTIVDKQEDTTSPTFTTVEFVPPTTPVATTENPIWHASGTCGRSDCDCTFDRYFDIPTDSSVITVDGKCKYIVFA